MKTAAFLSVLLVATSAHAMSDEQFEMLDRANTACFRHTHFDGLVPSYPKGFERCPEIQDTYHVEVQRRLAASEQDDSQEIAAYFSMFPPGGKLHLGPGEVPK